MSYASKFIVTSGDTDSICFGKKDGSPITEKEQNEIIEEINSIYPSLIKWAHDGYFPNLLILKAKNYAMWDGKKIKIKGSSLKDQKKEKALQDLMFEVVNSLLGLNNESPLDIYNKYVYMANNVTDITAWASKKTITDKLLTSERKNESSIRDAFGDTIVQEGDKIFVYKTNDNVLKLTKNFSSDHSVTHLLKRIYATISIFENVVNMDQFLNYSLKRNQEELQELLANYNNQ